MHDAISDSFQEGDRLVYLGNYIGYGNTVLETIDELLDFRRRVLGFRYGSTCDVVFLRGAQEEMWQKLLQLQFAPNPREVLEWMVRAGMEVTVRAYGGDLRQGFAAARDGPRSITRWTGALRSGDERRARPYRAFLGIASCRIHRGPGNALRRRCGSTLHVPLLHRVMRSGGDVTTFSP